MKHKNIFRGILLGQTCIEKKKRTWYHQLVRSCSGICVAFQIVPEQPEKPMFEQMMLKSLLYHDKDALQPRYYLIKVTSNYMFKATQEDGWREQYLTNGQWATQRTWRATSIVQPLQWTAASRRSRQDLMQTVLCRGVMWRSRAAVCEMQIIMWWWGGDYERKSHWSREKRWRIKIGVMEDGWPTTLHGNI